MKNERKFIVSDIHYCIEPEDVDLNEDDYALRSDYIEACEKEIDRIVDSLPDEITVTLNNETDENIDDDLANAISDKTGWLVGAFSYEEVLEK